MKNDLVLIVALMASGISGVLQAAECTVTGNALVCEPDAVYSAAMHGGKPLGDYDAVTVTTTQDNSFGYVQWSNQAQYKDFTITTHGRAADGVRLINWGPTVVFNNLHVTTTGASADGINLGRDATDSKLTVLGKTTIRTDDGMGIRSVSSAIGGSTGPHTILLNGASSIVTSGNGSRNAGYAVYAGNNESGCGPFSIPLFACKAVGPGEIYLSGTTADVHNISTFGQQAHAIYANGHAYIKVNNIRVQTYGNGAHGVVAQRVASAYYVSSSDSGLQDYAGLVELTGNVAIETQGNNAYALYVDSYSAADGKDSRGKIASIRSYDSSTNQVVSDKIYRIRGDMMAINSGVLDLSMGNESSFTGQTYADNSGVINLHLAGNRSVWNMTGNSTITHLALTNAALIYADGATFSPKTLTVTNDLRSDNGTLYLNTVLGDDHSATDKLIVQGQTSGYGRLKIINAGGTGAQTVEGIKVIEVFGASNGNFTLDGDYRIKGQPAVVAGAYAYTLHKNGLAQPNDGSWYLRSQLKEGSPSVFQAGVPVYEIYPQALLALNSLTTLQQRVGNRVWADASATTDDEYAVRTGGWARIEGMRSSIAPTWSDSQASYRGNTYKVQAGLDKLLYEDSARGQLLAGLYAQYSNGRTSVSSFSGDGKINSNGYGAAATLTWFGVNDVYIDGQLQFNFYNSDLHSGLTGGRLTSGNRATGYAASAEIGRHIDTAAGWRLTPQAQLTYSEVKFDRFNDVFAVGVKPDKGASLLGRLGLSLDYARAWQGIDGKTRRQHSYVIVNLYNEFMDGTRVDVAGVGFNNRSDRLWGGVGLGMTYSWGGGKYTVYGEGMLNSSLSHFGDSYAVTGMVGLRAAF